VPRALKCKAEGAVTAVPKMSRSVARELLRLILAAVAAGRLVPQYSCRPVRRLCPRLMIRCPGIINTKTALRDKNCMSQPFLSIIVPVYNREAFVARCIDSVLQQDRNDYEIIAVDDGSSDRSVEVLSRHAAVRLNRTNATWGCCAPD
jgi:Glycosyl transferase family 2